MVSPSHAQWGADLVFDPQNLAKNTITAAQTQRIASLLMVALSGAGTHHNIDATLLRAIREVLDITNAIHYGLDDPGAVLQKRFPGYDYTPSQETTWYEDEERALRAETTTVRALLDAVHEGLSDEQQARDIADLIKIATNVQATMGIRGVLQYNVQTGVFAADQLMRLRESVGALVNLQAVTSARAAHDQAVSKKIERELIEKSVHPIPKSVMR